MKVFIVTAGEYSDYHIDAVFSDEKQARLYCVTHSRYDFDYGPREISEWEVDEVEIVAEKEPKRRWVARFDYNGILNAVWPDAYTFDDMPFKVVSTTHGRYIVEKTFDCETAKEKIQKVFCDNLMQWMTHRGG